MLSHRAVLEHVQRYGRTIGVRPDDKVVSWLPLYHDMGLIAAFHLPLALEIPWSISTRRVGDRPGVDARGVVAGAGHPGLAA